MTMQPNEEHGGKVLAVRVSGTVHHFSDIGKRAMPGEKEWQQGIASFCKPFTKAMVRYFDHSDAAEAGRWLDKA